jgi:hypothetical protein
MCHSVAQLVAHGAVELEDAFELPAEDLRARSNVTVLSDRRTAPATPRTLAECVPLLTVALELVSRGPASLTVDGIEQYRGNAIRLIEHVRPVIEREAGRTDPRRMGDRSAGRSPDRAGPCLSRNHHNKPDTFPEEVSDANVATRCQARRQPDGRIRIRRGATTLEECVPLLAIMVELIKRGPASITVEGVERYRTMIMQLLEHVRPAVESEAKRSLAEWTSRLLDEPMPTRLAA